VSLLTARVFFGGAAAASLPDLPPACHFYRTTASV